MGRLGYEEYVESVQATCPSAGVYTAWLKDGAFEHVAKRIEEVCTRVEKKLGGLLVQGRLGNACVSLLAPDRLIVSLGPGHGREDVEAILKKLLG